MYYNYMFVKDAGPGEVGYSCSQASSLCKQPPLLTSIHYKIIIIFMSITTFKKTMFRVKCLKPTIVSNSLVANSQHSNTVVATTRKPGSSSSFLPSHFPQ